MKDGAIHLENKKKTKGITRRDFIKLAGIGLAALFGPDLAYDTALQTVTEGMEFKIPPEFEGKKIPERNENFRSPDGILLEAIDIYDEFRRKERLPRTFTTQGPEYLSLKTIAEKFPRLFDDEQYEDYEGLHYRLYGMIMDHDIEEEIKNADTPEIHSFSAFSQNGIIDHIWHNPGSAILYQAEEYIRQKYGWTRGQMIASMARHDTTLPEVKPEDWETASKIVASRMNDAINYLEEIRNNRGGPISVSESIAYFLYQNKGDLKKSLWDTTLLLKMIARNDIDTQYSNNTYEKAERVGNLFMDEFSPKISHNWLIEQFKEIPEESGLRLAGAWENEQYKNFMPINKAGTYYHVMNIITWAATCMDPWVVKSMVTAYYHEHRLGSIDHRLEHGIDKVQADVEAAQSADRIQRVVVWNA